MNSHLRRLPIRVRLTIAFATAMAAVLAAARVFVYPQSRSDLDAQIDAALRSDAADLEALVRVGRVGAVTTSGVGLAQVYAADGRVLVPCCRRRLVGSVGTNLPDALVAPVNPSRDSC